jgi:hypothetical protein
MTVPPTSVWFVMPDGAPRSRPAITSYTEPGLGPGGATTLFGGLSTDSWTAYADLAASGELQARVSVLLLPAPMGGSANDVRAGPAELRRPESADPRLLRAIGVKIFADGVPPNRTAWVNGPYADGGHGALCVHGATPALQVDALREIGRGRVPRGARLRPDGRGGGRRALRPPVARAVRRRRGHLGLRLQRRADHGARQDFAESWQGSVEVGKVAGLCVLDRPSPLCSDPEGHRNFSEFRHSIPISHARQLPIIPGERYPIRPCFPECLR